ncbi:MAG: cyclophilin-like fold protein [Clostridia bacterium]|nr:cyclophilin-like fold protein [Clostridia bacterium]
MINIEVNGEVLQVRLCDNSSADAIKALLGNGPLTLPMKDYAHMEKFGNLGRQFPRNDEHITTQAGDVILSEGNLLVIYYAPNTWNFTRIGKIQNTTEKELRKILGKGNITATLSLPISKGDNEHEDHSITGQSA